MSDINKVWVSGLVVNRPLYTRLASRTPITTFAMEVNERFIDGQGKACVKTNTFNIESLGRGAELSADRVHQGKRYMIDGYLRSDVIEGVEQVRVRTFAVHPDDTTDTVNYTEGLRQAIEVLKRSRNLQAAIEELEDMAQ